MGDCEGRNVERYKAYPKHLRYKACDAGVKDDSVIPVTETFDTRVTLTELRPYSRSKNYTHYIVYNSHFITANLETIDFFEIF